MADARQLLKKFSKRDAFACNRLIALYTKQGRAEEALNIFWKMVHESVQPNEVSLINIFKACAILGALEQGQEIHDYIVKTGIKQNVMIVNSLLNMYAKCGNLAVALQLFEKMSKRNVVSWNSMITAYTQHGHPREAFGLFDEMVLDGVKPNEITFVNILKASSSLENLELGKYVHTQVIQRGFKPNIFIGNTLIDMYAKCGSIEDACQVFEELPMRDVVSWTAMIAGCVECGYAQKALQLFQQMHCERVKPNNVTFVSILKGCVRLGDLEIGKQIHDHIRKTAFEFDNVLASALINMYAMFGRILDAQKVFEKMPRENMLPWAAMIAGYVHHGNDLEALTLYWKMREERVKVDAFTFVSLLKACVSLKAFEEAKQIHMHIIEKEFESDLFVGSTLIDTYAKCGSIKDAQLVFNRLPKRDVVSWSAMIAGCVQHGEAEAALHLFEQMQLGSTEPSESTFISVLNACASLAILEEGRKIHSHILNCNLELNISVGNTLIDMYAKCGSIKDARSLLEKMQERDLFTWTAMISGFAQHGSGEAALQLCNQMQLEGMKLDHVTFIGLLSACSQAGLVDEAHHFFESMTRDHSIIPTEEHYALMVDLLGRGGCLQEAEEFIRRMPIKPTAVVWRSLLSACSIHGNLEVAIHAVKSILNLEPQNGAAYVLLSNMLAATGRWDSAAQT